MGIDEMISVYVKENDGMSGKKAERGHLSVGPPSKKLITTIRSLNLRINKESNTYNPSKVGYFY